MEKTKMPRQVGIAFGGKNKYQVYLLASFVLIFSVFLVRIDKVNAECGDVAADYDPGGCLGVPASGGETATCNGANETVDGNNNSQCVCVYGYEYDANGTTCIPVGGTAAPTNPYAYDQAQCDKIYGPGYAPNADATGCDSIGTAGCVTNCENSGGFNCEATCSGTSSQVICSKGSNSCVLDCTNDQPSATVGSCRTCCGVNGVTQADCNAYGEGMTPNVAGTDCIPNRSGSGGATGNTLAPTSGVGAECASDSDCGRFGIGFNCLDDSGPPAPGQTLSRHCALSSLGQQLSSAYNGVGGPAVRLTAPLMMSNGQYAPVGSYALPDNSVYGPTGQQLGTAQSTPVGSNVNIPATNTATNTSGRSAVRLTSPLKMTNGQTAPVGSYVLPDSSVIGPAGQVLGVALTAPVGENVTIPDTSGGTTSQTCKSGFDSVGGVCFPSSTTAGGLPDPPGGVKQIITNLFSWLIGIFTAVAIIAFIISGLQYLTSAGNEEQIETAKRNATWSIVGILVGLSGFVIIQAIARFLAASSRF